MTAVRASEWRKLWSLRSTPVILGVVVALTLGISWAIVVFAGVNAAQAQQDGTYAVIFFGSSLGVWAFAVLAAEFVTTEFRGAADHTFVATPRRSRVLLAKSLIVAGLGLVVGPVVSVATVVVTQGGLALGGFPTLQLDDPGLWRAVLVYVGLNMAVQRVLAALVAVLVRNAFGAVVVVLMLSALPPSLAESFGPAFTELVPRWIPGAAVESVAGLSQVGSAGYLALPAALLAVAIWIGLFAAVSFPRLDRADAR